MQGLDELYDIMDAVWLDAVLGEEKKVGQQIEITDRLLASFSKATEFFEEDVKDTVPEEKLLVFKVLIFQHKSPLSIKSLRLVTAGSHCAIFCRWTFQMGLIQD